MKPIPLSALLVALAFAGCSRSISIAGTNGGCGADPACVSDAGPQDAGPDDAGPEDAGGSDAGAPCGDTTCTATQACVQDCSGIALPGDAGAASSCVDVPAACAESTSCSCFGATNPCPTGSCVSVERGVPRCLCASAGDAGSFDAGPFDAGEATPCGEDGGVCDPGQLCFVVTGCGGFLPLDAGNNGGCRPPAFTCESAGSCALSPTCDCFRGAQDPCAGSQSCEVDGGTVSCQFDYP